MSLWHAERGLRTAGRKDLAKIVAGVREAFGGDIALPEAQSAKKYSKAKEVSPHVELNLDAEWQRQAQNYLNLGFHTEAGFSDTDEGKQAFLDSLPKFEPQPEEYKGKFDMPLLVIKKIPWERQAELAGIDISDYLRSMIDKTREWKDNPAKTLDVFAYTGWFNNWGQRFAEKISPFDARKQLTLTESGGGPHEGIALQVNHPEFNQDSKYFDLIGYDVGSASVPDLDHWVGRSRLDAHWGGIAGSNFRPLVRGSKIVIG